MQFLYQTIKEIIETGRVGTPVFVRFVVQIMPSGEHILDTLARFLVITGSWLTSIPIRVYVQHKENSAQITASAEYAGGQTAIVSVNIANVISSRIDLMMIGNKGAVYQDSEMMPPGFDVDFEPLSIPEWLMDAIEQSLFAGKPVSIEEVVDLE
jgi:hypothetical protein